METAGFLLLAAFVGWEILEIRHAKTYNELRRKNAELSRISSDIDRVDKFVIDFVFETILFRVRMILDEDSFDPMLLAKRIPRWIDEFSCGDNSYFRSMVPKHTEDALARRIAQICKYRRTVPFDIFLRQEEYAHGVISREIDPSISDKSYFAIACSHLVFSEILDSPNTSKANRLFFDSLKKKWPTFTWSDEDEFGCLEDEYE